MSVRQSCKSYKRVGDYTKMLRFFVLFMVLCAVSSQQNYHGPDLSSMTTMEYESLSSCRSYRGFTPGILQKLEFTLYSVQSSIYASFIGSIDNNTCPTFFFTHWNYRHYSCSFVAGKGLEVKLCNGDRNIALYHSTYISNIRQLANYSQENRLRDIWFEFMEYIAGIGVLAMLIILLVIAIVLFMDPLVCAKEKRYPFSVQKAGRGKMA